MSDLKAGGRQGGQYHIYKNPATSLEPDTATFETVQMYSASDGTEASARAVALTGMPNNTIRFYTYREILPYPPYTIYKRWSGVYKDSSGNAFTMGQNDLSAT